MELVPAGGVLGHFLAISNELTTPKTLCCPQDDTRKEVARFTNLRESDISYFIGLDARRDEPGMFLIGDRNITNDFLPPNRILELTSNSQVGWTEKIHQNQGNVGLTDGSVSGLSTSRLRDALANTGYPTNRLALPLY